MYIKTQTPACLYGAKPLTEPMLFIVDGTVVNRCQLKIESKYWNIHSRNCFEKTSIYKIPTYLLLRIPWRLRSTTHQQQPNTFIQLIWYQLNVLFNNCSHFGKYG